MARIIYIDKDHNIAEYNVRKITQKRLAISGVFLSKNAKITQIKVKQFDFEPRKWKQSVGWTKLKKENNQSWYKLRDHKHETITKVEINSLSNNSHHVLLTEYNGNQSLILTFENDTIIVLAAIAAISCIGTIALSLLSLNCKEQCGEGNVKRIKVGIVWNKGFIPTCGFECECKD